MVGMAQARTTANARSTPPAAGLTPTAPTAAAGGSVAGAGVLRRGTSERAARQAVTRAARALSPKAGIRVVPVVGAAPGGGRGGGHRTPCRTPGAPTGF